MFLPGRPAGAAGENTRTPTPLRSRPSPQGGVPVPECNVAGLVRSSGLDDIDGSPDGGVYIQMRGVEQVRVRGLREGRRRARAVAFVASLDVREDLTFVRRHALRRQLARAAAGTLLRTRGNENLHVRIGRNHRRDVAPIEHRAARTGRKLPLG